MLRRLSSSVTSFVPVLASEHTAKAFSSAFCFQSVSVCDSSASEGTSTITKPEGAMRWAIFIAVNVLPVPQAMMSLPRSAVERPFTTASTARLW